MRYAIYMSRDNSFAVIRNGDLSETRSKAFKGVLTGANVGSELDRFFKYSRKSCPTPEQERGISTRKLETLSFKRGPSVQHTPRTHFSALPCSRSDPIQTVLSGHATGSTLYRHRHHQTTAIALSLSPVCSFVSSWDTDKTPLSIVKQENDYLKLSFIMYCRGDRRL
jgi:hypothetical protein